MLAAPGLRRQLPQPKRRVSKPGDWKPWQMTVCIAAMCENSKTLVLVSDRKISFGTFSGENMAVKAKALYGPWVGMYSGNDVSHAMPVLSTAGDLLDEYHKKNGAPGPSTVVNLLQEAYWRRLKHQIETQVLRRHGFTVETFRQEGKNSCTESVYAKLTERIATTSLGQLTFLVAGFDDYADGSDGHLWTVGEDDAPQCYDGIGMWAIGSGQSAALSSLAFHVDKGQLSPPYSSLSDTLYCVCAAKFMAESASEVADKYFRCRSSRPESHRAFFDRCRFR